MSPGETCRICGSPDIQLASFSMETQLWTHWCSAHLPAYTPMEASQAKERFLEYVIDDMYDLFPMDDGGQG